MDAIETLKSLGKAALSISNLEQKAAILELVNKAQTDVFELRQQTLTMQAEITDLKRQITDREREDQLLAALKFERNVYWKNGIPYCPACFGEKGKCIPLTRHEGTHPDGDCPLCQYVYSKVFDDERQKHSATRRARHRGF